MPQPEISVEQMIEACLWAAHDIRGAFSGEAKHLEAAAARLREMQEFAQCTPGLGDCKTCPLCGAIHD